jgi:hypothetical protein
MRTSRQLHTQARANNKMCLCKFLSWRQAQKQSGLTFAKEYADQLLLDLLEEPIIKSGQK